MRRLWRRLLVVIAVLGAAHLYIWWQLVAPLPSPWSVAGTAIVALGMPTLPIAMRIARRLPRDRARSLLRPAYLWFALATYLLLAAAATQVAVAFGAPPRLTGALAAGLALATVLGGLLHVARGPQVRRVEIPLPRLGVDAYTIVQLTDVHIGTALGRDFAERVVRQVNELSPDLVVITGDFIDGPLAELRPHVEPFRNLRARDGVFAVTGNHEFYWETRDWLTHIRSLGIRVLRNEHVTIGGAFQLAGVDDPIAGEDVAAALHGRDGALPVVLLAHRPRTVGAASAAGVDLQLSGHTHGGQLLPLGWLSRLFDPQVAGLGRFGATWLYVSEGTGYWGPPVRIGTTQEIAALTLVPARPA